MIVLPPLPFPYSILVAGLGAAAGVAAKALADDDNRQPAAPPANNVHVVVNMPPGTSLDADAIREAVAAGIAAGLKRGGEDEAATTGAT